MSKLPSIEFHGTYLIEFDERVGSNNALSCAGFKEPTLENGVQGAQSRIYKVSLVKFCLAKVNVLRWVLSNNLQP